jgi:hypothetical protein
MPCTVLARAAALWAEWQPPEEFPEPFGPEELPGPEPEQPAPAPEPEPPAAPEEVPPEGFSTAILKPVRRKNRG